MRKIKGTTKSGWCLNGLPEGQHEKCPGIILGKPCGCSCHSKKKRGRPRKVQ